MNQLTNYQRSIIKRYGNDWLGFTKYILGIDLYSKQREILRSVQDHTHVAVRSCNGAGKSFVSAAAALCYLYTRPNSQVVLTAPKYEQAHDVLYGTLRKILAMNGGYNKLWGDVQDRRIRINPHWQLKVATSKDEHGAKGVHSDAGVFIILDEVAGMDIDIIEALSTTTLSDECKTLEIGNPTTMNCKFYERFTGNTGWVTHHMSAYHIPTMREHPLYCGDPSDAEVDFKGTTTPAWVEQKKLEHGEESAFWSHAILGEFPDQSETQLISLQEVETAMARPDTSAEYDVRCLGVDMSGDGSDMTIVTMIGNNRVKVLHEEYKTDEVDLANRILHLIDEYNINGAIGVDASGGYGGGTCSLLSKAGKNVLKVDFGKSPRDDKMYNKRAELFWNVRNFVRDEAELGGSPPRLKADLIGIEYYYDDKGRFAIEKKKEMKKRLGYSIDYADSLAVAVEARRLGRSTELAAKLTTLNFAQRNVRGRHHRWR